jgi:hypothetical protein
MIDYIRDDAGALIQYGSDKYADKYYSNLAADAVHRQNDAAEFEVLLNRYMNDGEVVKSWQVYNFFYDDQYTEYCYHNSDSEAAAAAVREADTTGLQSVVRFTSNGEPVRVWSK